jgi:hypothetical protein
MTAKHNAKDPTSELRLQDTLRLSADGLAKVRPHHARRLEDRQAGTRACGAQERHRGARGGAPHRYHRAEQDGGQGTYRACVTEAEFRKQMSRRAVEGILSLGLQAVAASFVDVRSSFLSSRHIAAKSWTAVSRSATAMVAHATSTSCIRLPRRKVPPDRVRSLMAVCTSASGMLQSNLPAWSAT